MKNRSLFYANSQINVGGTTILDIGNDLSIKGGVINTNRAQGTIGGNTTIESLQDTATYDSDQKNMGFSADLDLAKGTGSSLSVNGGKTNVNADYKAVGEQSGLFTGDGGLDLTADGKTTLIGGAITTTEAARDAGRNNYESLGGITTQDIKNTTSYDGDAIQVGVSIGQTDNKPQASMNGLGYGSDSDSDSSVTRAGITGIAGNEDITTDNRAEYAGILENSFDAGRVNEELGAQTQITQAFDQERRKVKNEINAKEKKLRDEAEEQGQLGNTT
ncbi:hemagglutinin repeat-containing protein, partial [Psychrobacter sp. FME61]